MTAPDLAPPDAGDVLRCDPRTDPAWAVLAARPDASVFTSPPWIAAVCGTYGFVPRALVAVDEGGPRAGFAWVEISDLRGDRAVSLPFSDRAEPFAGPGLHGLLDAAVCADAPLTVRCLSPAGGLEDRFAVTARVAWHGTPLRGDHAELLGSVSAHARRNLRHAQRAGVRVERRDDVQAVRVLHGLHVDLRRDKYGLLAQPLAFFEAIWGAFAPRGQVATLLAEHDGEVVAGALLLAWNDVVYYKFGASRLGHLAARPNDAVFAAALGWATERGARLLDWGISDLDQPGLIAFKEKWGGERGDVLTWRAGGEQARTDPAAGVLLGELTRLLTGPGVPTEVTRRGGDLLYRYFC